jgi:signal transduction histidine kinase
MDERILRGAAWGLCVAASVLLLVSAGLAIASWSYPPAVGYDPWSSMLIRALIGLGAPILGAILAGNPQSVRYGLWWCLLAIGYGTTSAATAYVSFAVAQGTGPAALGTAALLGDLGWVTTTAALPFLLLNFPDGRPPTPRWRALSLTLATAAAVAVVGALLTPEEAGTVPIDRAVLISAVPEVGMAMIVGGVVVLLAGNLPAVASLVARYRGAEPSQRAQLKWFGYAAVVFAATFAAVVWWDAPGVWDSVVEGIPVVVLYIGVGVAVLRHRIYDIDLLINRTLVYGVLSAVVIGTYVGIVGYLSALFETRASLPLTLAATAVIALAFQPLRERVQRAVNRVLYGARDDPFAVVSKLARSLEAAIPAEAVLPTVVETTAQALRLPHVSIWQNDGDRIRLSAAYGARPAADSVATDDAVDRVMSASAPIELTQLQSNRLASALAGTGATLIYPLHHRGSAVGLLCLAPRTAGEAWSSTDRATLGDLARQAGAAVHAATLTAELQRSLAELQRSRELLVTAQERERRRIQQDLHDGLGPTLAAIRMHLEAHLDGEPPADRELRNTLERVDELVREAAADVRRIVGGLHPPTLAQLGLVPALRAHVEQFGRDVGIAARFSGQNGIAVSPAVELAVFRVAQEALTNAARHARASTVDVALSLSNGRMHLVVSDNGAGLPLDAAARGTGLAGMRERSALIGGQLTVDGNPGKGTRVELVIPLEVPH